MRIFVYICVALSLFIAMVYAEAPVEGDPAAIKQELRETEDMAKALIDQFLAVDARVEMRIEQIVLGLKSIEDSRRSNMRVLEMKQNAIQGLGQAVEYYRKERQKVLKAYEKYNTDMARADLDRQLDYYSKKSEQRIQDISDLSASLSRHQGFEAVLDESYYKTTAIKSAQGGAKRDEARHQALLESRAQETVGSIEEAMRTDIGLMNEEVERLKLKVETVDDPSLRKEMYKEINQREAQIDRRLTQLREALTPDSTVAKEVGNKQSQEMLSVLGTISNEISQDFEEMGRLRKEINALLGKRWRVQKELEKMSS